MRPLPFLLLLLSLLCVCVLAAEDAATKTPEPIIQEPILPSPDVRTAYVFPDFPAKKIPSGEIVEVLLGFTNTGRKEFNITTITASLNHPVDTRYYIQNFTKAEYGLLVGSEEQVSLSYKFRPDPMLEPRDFVLILSVFYHDEGLTNYTTPFFNNTISITEPDIAFDFQKLFLYVGFAAVLGLIGFLVYRNWAEKNAQNKPKQKKEQDYNAKRAEKIFTAADKNEWLEGTTAASKGVKKRK